MAPVSRPSGPGPGPGNGTWSRTGLDTTEISEVFSSLQGEGPYLGQKQIFVRFGRCNMHCTYCDEVPKMQQGMYKTVSQDELLNTIDALERADGPHHSISLTGGEPLFYSGFLKSFLPELKNRNQRVYLETNGTLPEQLKPLLGYIDIVAMDIKPPSSSGDRAFWKQHEAFLKLSASKEVFVKIVVTPGTLRSEIEQSIDLVAAVNPKIPFVFQPETEMTGISLKALEKIKSEFAQLAQAKLSDVRVIPQMHKVWGVR